jgi:uncharacterized protein (TIGR03437 family)
MKHLGLIFLATAVALPAHGQVDFLTGQAAREVFGQPTFTYEGSGPTSAAQLGAASGVAYANDTLFVVDSNPHGLLSPNNNRVLIYKNISKFVYAPLAEIPQGSGCPVCVGDPSVGQASLVLGQPDFTTTTNPYTTQFGFRNPTGIASDGNILVLGDTDNNRVLIWKTIPTTIDQPADIVLGQTDFTTSAIGLTSSALRGPQGVWVQGNRIFVADTDNSRVMIWNRIPTSNNQPADVVLGEPNFTTAPPATTSNLPATASNLFNPVSVTSDGQRLIVTDLGNNRVLIWNSIPTQNAQPADVVVGQPNMTSGGQNDVLPNCVMDGTDADGYPTYKAGCVPFCKALSIDSDNTPVYPIRCGYTLSYPRFALSDGTRLFIADSGNDRVLVYDSIPTTNGAKYDRNLGQTDEFTDQVSTPVDTFRPDANILESAPNTVRTPLALASDGTNLYVSDPNDLRIVMFTPGSSNIPLTGITNSYSLATYAVGSVSLGGTITATDTITIDISAPNITATTCPAAGLECYTYTVLKTDTLVSVTQNLANLINGVGGKTPDPNVIATTDIISGDLYILNLTARTPGVNGNSVGYTATAASASSTGTATETVTTAGSTLAGGAAAAELAPGTLVSIFGQDLADSTASAVPSATGSYPTTFNGVQVYFDGVRSPILSVSPTQINAQLPFDLSNAINPNGGGGASAFVRTVHNDGSVTATTAIGVPIVGENPGILAKAGTEPRVAYAYHTSGNAVVAVAIDGNATAGDVVTLTIDNNSYNYTVQQTDTLQSIRDALIVLVNANPNERVTAAATGEFADILLTAKVGGPAGNGIPVTTLASNPTGSTTTEVLDVLESGMTCCANIANAPLTNDNPAVPGEVITIYATGIGQTTLEDGVTPAGVTGQIYQGPALNVPVTAVDNAQVGGTTANILAAGLFPGLLGVYQVQLQLSDSLPTDLLTQMYIAQNVFTSNIVTIPVVAQAPPASSSAVKARGRADTGISGAARR